MIICLGGVLLVTEGPIPTSSREREIVNLSALGLSSSVLLYPRILPRDWLHWAFVGLCAIAGSVAVMAPQQTPLVTVAMGSSRRRWPGIYAGGAEEPVRTGARSRG